jgi:hypothetical protein
MKELTLIGRVERIDLIKPSVKAIPAKIDTGADASSIWAQTHLNDDGGLDVVFFGEGSPFYDGKVHTFQADEFSVTRVANSFGHREIRYKVKLSIKVNGRVIKGTFTLADRANKLYPILLGRTLLLKKFIVDVSQGAPLKKAESARRKRLQTELKNIKES